ncbi:MAG: protoglobin domain-containing protein [Verrucomicrobiales bacterium]|nr:protoglobin domain-containing protein [Verrucomicrobiales bacterium]
MTTDHELDQAWQSVLEKAKSLTGFCHDDETVIQEAAEALLPHNQKIVAHFYDALFSNKDATEIFKHLNQDRAMRELILQRWLESLLQGNYDDQFWRWQWLVGLTHVQHHVEPVYVLSMFTQLQNNLAGIIFKIFDTDSSERLILAYSRIIGCLTALAVEGYHREFISAVATTGLEGAVLNRLVAIEVKNKIEAYRKLLPNHPTQTS